jgi:hypothetical protein
MPAENELQERISRAAAAVVRNGYLGGELQAAFRQGLNELGAALKAFPDSLQVDEPGAAWNPLYRDIPGNNRPTVHGGPPAMVSQPKSEVSMATPSITESILANPQAYLSPQRQGPEQGQAMGQDKGQPSIGPDQSITAAILDNPQSFLTPDQQRQNGQEHQQPHDHGREM